MQLMRSTGICCVVDMVPCANIRSEINSMRPRRVAALSFRVSQSCAQKGNKARGRDIRPTLSR